MKGRFLADVNVKEAIISGVLRREPSISFKTAVAAGLHGLPDFQVLQIAAAEGRILVTHDRKTMPYAFGNFIANHTSPGVIIVKQQSSIIAAIDELLMIWAASEAEDWFGMLVQVRS
jgi:hypothetical protein